MSTASTSASLSRRIGRALDAPGPATRIPALDGLRAVAVFLVFLVHYDALFAPFTSPAGWNRSLSAFWGIAGNSGVDLFFLLSGYLIYGILLARPRGYGQFLLRRAHRLYPTFLFVFLFYVASLAALPSALTSPDKHSLTFLYLIQNLFFLPGVFPIAPLIPVAWSLSYEAAFYLVAPLIISLLGLRERSRSRRVVFLASFFLLQAALMASGILAHPRMLMFTAGALLWETAASGVLDSRLGSRSEFASALLFLAALIPAGLIPLYQPAGSWANTLLSLLRVAILAAAFPLALHGIRFDGRIRAFLDAAPVRALGNISYSYYLIHGASMHIARSALAALVPAPSLSPVLYWAAVLPAVFLFTFAVSAVLYVAVEKPFSFPSAARRLSAAPSLPTRFVAPLAAPLCPAPAVDGAPRPQHESNTPGRLIQE